MGLSAGKLRHRVTILSQKTVTDTSATGAPAVNEMGEILPVNEMGETVNEWQTFTTLWANFTPLSVKSVMEAQAAGNKTVARCVIRYRDDINSSMRVLYREKTYVIDGDPLPDAESGLDYLTLMLASVENDR